MTAEPEERPQLSPEEMLGAMTKDLTEAILRLKALDERHQTTVTLMRMLASNLDLELMQEQTPDGRVLLGWRKKAIVRPQIKLG